MSVFLFLPVNNTITKTVLHLCALLLVALVTSELPKITTCPYKNKAHNHRIVYKSAGNCNLFAHFVGYKERMFGVHKYNIAAVLQFVMLVSSYYNNNNIIIHLA